MRIQFANAERTPFGGCRNDDSPSSARGAARTATPSNACRRHFHLELIRIESGVVDAHLALCSIPGDPGALREKNSTSFSRSVISGTFNRRTGSPASKVAQRIGSAEFLFPDGTMVPDSGLPPLMMRSAMDQRENKEEPLAASTRWIGAQAHLNDRHATAKQLARLNCRREEARPRGVPDRGSLLRLDGGAGGCPGGDCRRQSPVDRPGSPVGLPKADRPTGRRAGRAGPPGNFGCGRRDGDGADRGLRD